MFTGIVEAVGRVTGISRDRDNVIFTFSSPFTHELKVDQSLAHDGVCLTVTSVSGEEYTVTAVAETLKKTSLGQLKVGSPVNLERCMKAGGRLDGHIVQGHVDARGTVEEISEEGGSWKVRIRYDEGEGRLTVPHGSVTVNGVSLTVAESLQGAFYVAIIPYTFENTTFSSLKAGDLVNLEFDIIGKYVAALLGPYGAAARN